MQKLEDLLPSIDKQLAAALAERDLAVADKWFNQATDAIE